MYIYIYIHVYIYIYIASLIASYVGASKRADPKRRDVLRMFGKTASRWKTLILNFPVVFWLSCVVVGSPPEQKKTASRCTSPAQVVRYTGEVPVLAFFCFHYLKLLTFSWDPCIESLVLTCTLLFLFEHQQEWWDVWLSPIALIEGCKIMSCSSGLVLHAKCSAMIESKQQILVSRVVAVRMHLGHIQAWTAFVWGGVTLERPRVSVELPEDCLKLLCFSNPSVPCSHAHVQLHPLDYIIKYLKFRFAFEQTIF